MPEGTYSVYLVQHHGEQGGKREVTSPVRGTELDFYDSGVWLSRETGRNFFPYEQIRTIREHPEGKRTESESRTPQEGESSQSEESEPSQSEAAEFSHPEAGESGAEEELLEE